MFTLQYHDQPGDAPAGEQLFAAKGCAQCHEVGGKGGRLGPSLDFLKGANSPVLIAAALWNHGPEMAEMLKSVGLERAAFAGKELADLVAYLQTAGTGGGAGRPPVAAGVPERGEKVFREKGCLTCHTVAGKGGKVGPELGRRHHVSLTQFAGLMWNHAPGMWAQMRARGIQVPRMTGQEMADVVAYLYAAHYFDQAGDAARGQQLVQGKDCLTCHAWRGKGPKIGADLASYPALRSTAGLVASLWNHPRYLDALKRGGPLAGPHGAGARRHRRGTRLRAEAHRAQAEALKIFGGSEAPPMPPRGAWAKPPGVDRPRVQERGQKRAWRAERVSRAPLGRRHPIGAAGPVARRGSAGPTFRAVPAMPGAGTPVARSRRRCVTTDGSGGSGCWRCSAWGPCCSGVSRDPSARRPRVRHRGRRRVRPPGDAPHARSRPVRRQGAARAPGRARDPDVLDRLYCYCECDKHLGHKSLLSCYTDGHAPT